MPSTSQLGLKVTSATEQTPGIMNNNNVNKQNSYVLSVYEKKTNE